MHVIAAFAPIAGCSDALEVPEVQEPPYNPPPPACDGTNSPGCVPPVLDAGAVDAAAKDAASSDGAIALDASPRDATVVDTQCPAKAPTYGGACALPSGQTCDYEPYCNGRPTRNARCSQGKWEIGIGSCNPPPVQCPPSAPAEGVACMPGWGNRCYYGSCDAGGAEVTYECTSNAWKLVERCGVPVCPPVRPVPGLSCTRPPDAACGYDDCYGRPATIATCPNGTWSVQQSSCNPPAPMCPGLAPAEGSSCSLTPGFACTFSLSAGGTVIGTCVEGKWKLGVADAGT